MSEENKKRKGIDQSLPYHFVDKDYRMPGFEPRKVELPELGKSVEIKKERDVRFVTNYLAAKNVLRDLQKVKEAIEQEGYIDVEKEDKVNRAIRRILRAK